MPFPILTGNMPQPKVRLLRVIIDYICHDFWHMKLIIQFITFALIPSPWGLYEYKWLLPLLDLHEGRYPVLLLTAIVTSTLSMLKHICFMKEK